MITSFFKTSKPSHYLIFLAVLLGLFIFSAIHTYAFDLGPVNYLKELGAFCAFLMSLFVFVFVITKNDLTQKNSFAALYLCLFIFLLPQALSNYLIVLSNLFVLLSFRRIFSLKTNTNIKKKFFDSGFWIALACFFQPWAVLYFVPLVFAIFLLPSDYIKHICTVIFGIISVGLLVVLCCLVLNKDPMVWLSFSPQISLDFSIYNDLLMVLAIALLVSLSVWGMSSVFSEMVIKVSKSRFTFFMLFFAIAIGITIPILSPNKTIADFLFLVFPLAIVMANYTERATVQWMPNVFVLLVFLLALTKLAFNIEQLLEI